MANSFTSCLEVLRIYYQSCTVLTNRWDSIHWPWVGEHRLGANEPEEPDNIDDGAAQKHPSEKEPIPTIYPAEFEWKIPLISILTT